MNGALGIQGDLSLHRDFPSHAGLWGVTISLGTRGATTEKGVKKMSQRVPSVVPEDINQPLAPQGFPLQRALDPLS
jgi:hypothetical protein